MFAGERPSKEETESHTTLIKLQKMTKHVWKYHLNTKYHYINTVIIWKQIRIFIEQDYHIIWYNCD